MDLISWYRDDARVKRHVCKYELLYMYVRVCMHVNEHWTGQRNRLGVNTKYRHKNYR
jgi:hypothetical protein